MSPPTSFIFGCSRARTASRRRIPPKEINAWAKRLDGWSQGKQPADLPVVDAKAKPKAAPRDVFAYVIHEGKVRAPAAAMALIERLKE